MLGVVVIYSHLHKIQEIFKRWVLHKFFNQKNVGSNSDPAVLLSESGHISWFTPLKNENDNYFMETIKWDNYEKLLSQVMTE